MLLIAAGVAVEARVRAGGGRRPAAASLVLDLGLEHVGVTRAREDVVQPLELLAQVLGPRRFEYRRECPHMRA
jgi:hypothetical protein